MNELINSLSNRDLSIIFWFLIFIIFFISIDLRNFRQLIILLLNKYFIALYIIILLYFGSIVKMLSNYNIWEISYYKELVFWFITSGFALFSKIDKLNRLSDFIKIILKLLTINTFLEYLISLESFSFFSELILVPIILFITILFQVSSYKSKNDSKYQNVTKFLNSILVIFGLIILGLIIYRIIYDFDQYINYGNFKTFLVAPFLTIIYLPILYFIIVYIKYENAFMILNRYKFLDNKRNKKIKSSFLLVSNLNLRKLDNMKEMIIWNKSQLRDEQNILSFIKNNINHIEKKYND